MIDLLASFLPRPPEGCAPPVLGTLTDALAAGLASLPDLTQALTCMPWLHTPSTPANTLEFLFTPAPNLSSPGGLLQRSA